MYLQEIVEITRTLIQYHSVANNKKAIKSCLSYIESFFDDIDGVEKKEVTVEGKPSILFYTHGIDWQKPEYCFYGHVDVVDADEDLFIPKLKDNILYGRGSSDMKGVIAVQMVLFRDLVLKYPNLSLSLLIVSDEEVGGSHGAYYWVHKLGFSPNCIFVPDGGDNWELVIGEKGIYHLDIEFEGKPAHGSRPWLGENAGETLMKTYHKIIEQFPQRACSESDILPTVNLGRLSGGHTHNQVMGKSKLGLDIRFPATHSIEEIREKIQKCLPESAQVIEHVTEIPSALNLEDAYVKRFVDLIQKERGEIPQIVSCGGSDARYFLREGIPALIIKPECGGHHTDEEWATIHGYEQLYALYRDYILHKLEDS